MTKTLKSVKQKDREQLKAYKTVLDCIPLEEFYEDGIFLVKKGKKYENKYSATYNIKDISYLSLSKEMKENVFLAWAAVLNSLDTGITAKLSIIKRKLSAETIDRFYMQNDNPKYAKLKKDYNEIVRLKAMQGNGMIQDVYLTVSVFKQDIEAARSFFLRTAAALQSQLLKLGSSCRQLDGEERLELLHSIYRADVGSEVPFDLQAALKRGASAKSYIAPDGMNFEPDYFKLGNTFGRALVLHTYPSFLKDRVVMDLTSVNTPLIWSMDIIPVPTDEAVEEAERSLMRVDVSISKYFKAHKKDMVFEPSYDLKQQKEQAQEYLNDLTDRDQHLMYAACTMVVFADSKKELDEKTDLLLSNARTRQCRFNTLRYQQMDGLNTALPFGVRYVEDFMSFTTEGLATFMPFKTSEIQESNGFLYGQNQISKNLILIDPRNLKVANSIVLGKPGSGKSMETKWNMLTKALATADDEEYEIIILDPEREYGPLVKALGGEVVYLSQKSKTYINAMEVSAYADKDENPIMDKANFMLSLFEQIMYPAVLGPKHKTLIDRCTELTLHDYIFGGYQGTPPTLVDFHDKLLNQPEQEAKDLALALELYTTGSLSAFAKQTNINVNSRILCFDTYELGENLRDIAMLIVFDHIQRRMMQNRAKGIRTSINIDEFHRMLLQRFTAEFFHDMWKRGRKYGAEMNGITQNVEDCLRNDFGRNIISTSELLILLDQAPLDRETLSNLLDISEAQQEYITNAKIGTGLLKVNDTLIPFENEIPKTSDIYKLLTTKPEEVTSYGKN